MKTPKEFIQDKTGTYLDVYELAGHELRQWMDEYKDYVLEDCIEEIEKAPKMKVDTEECTFCILEDIVKNKAIEILQKHMK